MNVLWYFLVFQIIAGISSDIYRNLDKRLLNEVNLQETPSGINGRGEFSKTGKRGKRGKSMGSEDSLSTDDALGDFLRRPKIKGKKYVRKERTVSPMVIPVLGSPAINGTKPMIGSHSGRDAIFALAANYPLELFKFFVGSVRRFGYKDDIVLAVNPKKLMPPTTYQYLVEMDVVAYGFEVDCRKKDDCRLRDNFFG